MASGRPSRWPIRLLIVFVIAIPVGLGFLAYRMRGGTMAQLLPDAAITPLAATPVEAAPTPTVTPIASRTPLPALDQSDAFVRALVEALSSRPAWATWLATEGLARRFVVVVDNVAEGVAPTKHVTVLRPKEAFQATGRKGSLVVDPASYRRYDGVAEVFASLDTKGTAEAYRRLRPLLIEAYKDLGYPDRDFDVTLAAAIDRLLATPVPRGEVELRQAVKGYKLADPGLQSLAAAQRQFLRMGPDNMEKVQKKLRELREEIGLPKKP